MTAFPLKSEYSVAELIEFGQEIAALYGAKATATFVVACDGATNYAAMMVYPRPFAPHRYLKGESWIELLEAAEKDAAEYAVSNRMMVAADLGEF